MARFKCELPFQVGEKWCRRNFFSPGGKPIGEPRTIKIVQTDLPPMVAAASKKIEVVSGRGGKVPVIEVYLRLQSPAVTAGRAVVTIEAEVEGKLVPCAKVPGACSPGSSG
jgi:hypothetical protein